MYQLMYPLLLLLLIAYLYYLLRIPIGMRRLNVSYNDYLNLIIIQSISRRERVKHKS